MMLSYFHTGGTIGGVLHHRPKNLFDYTGGTATLEDMKKLFSSVNHQSSEQLSIYTTDNEVFIDSKNQTPTTLVSYASKIDQILQGPNCDAVIVTHGTDTMERAAFFTQIVLNPKKPVIFTGSMRPQGADGFDGKKNLADAHQLARSPEIRKNGGVYTVIGGKFFPYYLGKKEYGVSRDYLKSSGFGPIEDLQKPQIADLIKLKINHPHFPGAMKKYPELKCSVITLHEGSDWEKEFSKDSDKDIVGLQCIGSLSASMIKGISTFIDQHQTLFLIQEPFPFDLPKAFSIGKLSMEKSLILAKAVFSAQPDLEEAHSIVREQLEKLNHFIDMAEGRVLEGTKSQWPGQETPTAITLKPHVLDTDHLTRSLDAASKIKTFTCHDGCDPNDIPVDTKQAQVLILKCPGNGSIPDFLTHNLKLFVKNGGHVVVTTTALIPLIVKTRSHQDFIINTYFKYDDLFAIVHDHLSRHNLSNNDLKSRIENPEELTNIGKL